MEDSDRENQKKVVQAQHDFEENQEKYQKEYNENAFLKLVKKLPESITRPFVTIYYIMKHPGISAKEKALCIAALGYVVLPFDVIPDAIPLVGWLDDLGVVALALNMLDNWRNDPWVQEQVDGFYR